ncbi:Osmosensitive K+ channel histidine kinase KdpD [Planococcus halocryophilus Or1]|uniref:Histidine kinase n=1 Tax=Planococcus halocryophilus TaxID=1215089 RepID=A0A1C7DSS4_9BACL|nr:universal stress protein [Planococcus halocryophilus]ANU14331.1 histidine kinase [Planococcus halocryophilus]EMF45941.1 Osmosensitive K+ channel histidine kinase KdpD [Planococcus halocryophilus Or1]
MKKIRGRMDESILVCVFYGPNGERLINRGNKLATMLDCPLYILTVDSRSVDEFDAEKVSYIERWRELAEEYDAEEFIVRDNEKRPTAKVIGDVAHDCNITQIVMGQTARSRWEEITKGSFLNLLLREIPFVDLHVVSVARTVKGVEGDEFEKGVRCYLMKDGDSYKVNFTQSKNCQLEGIFFKEIGTDFDNGIFKFMHDNKIYQVEVTEDRIELPEIIDECLGKELVKK